jgi:ERCC4-type nuclease
MKLVIDNRETFALNEINKIDVSGNDMVEIVVQALPVGDFVFKCGEDDAIALVIERKTFDDLACSIMDGRFREQKTRLDEMKSNGVRIMYIIEGNSMQYKGKLPLTTLLSAILNLMMSHEYMVMFSHSIKNTVDMLCLIGKKLGEQGCTKGGSSGVQIKLKSKGEKIKENMFLLQMMVIPGVSQLVGEAICKEYKSMPDLIHAFEAGGEHILAEIKVNEKRKVGKALSSKVYKALGFI